MLLSERKSLPTAQPATKGTQLVADAPDTLVADAADTRSEAAGRQRKPATSGTRLLADAGESAK
jgi:hypothetical protein